jgi:transaldolase
MPLKSEAVAMARAAPGAEVLWASARELLNLFQAEATGCHVITITAAILKQLPLVGKDLGDYSLETVRTFFNDARQAGYRL